MESPCLAGLEITNLAGPGGIVPQKNEQGHQDSNLDEGFWRPSCYRCIMALCGIGDPRSTINLRTYPNDYIMEKRLNE